MFLIWQLVSIIHKYFRHKINSKNCEKFMKYKINLWLTMNLGKACFKYYIHSLNFYKFVIDKQLKGF